MVIPPFTPCPATGDAFIGRQGLVRNLRRRIARGESLAVIGGPKLGKTSLVRTALQGLTDHTSPTRRSSRCSRGCRRPNRPASS